MSKFEFFLHHAVSLLYNSDCFACMIICLSCFLMVVYLSLKSKALFKSSSVIAVITEELVITVSHVPNNFAGMFELRKLTDVRESFYELELYVLSNKCILKKLCDFKTRIDEST